MDDNLFTYAIQAVKILCFYVELSDLQQRLCVGASISYLGELRGQRIHDRLAENIVAILQDPRCEEYSYIYGESCVNDYYKVISNIKEQLIDRYELDVYVPKKERSKFIIEAAQKIYIREKIINCDEGVFIEPEKSPNHFWRQFRDSSLIQYLSMVKERDFA